MARAALDNSNDTEGGLACAALSPLGPVAIHPLYKVTTTAPPPITSAVRAMAKVAASCPWEFICPGNPRANTKFCRHLRQTCERARKSLAYLPELIRPAVSG